MKTKIKVYFNIDKSSSFIENGKEIKKDNEKVNFLSDLKNVKEDKNIPRKFFEKEIKNFEKENPSGYKILENMQDFLKNNKLDNTKSILSTILFIKQLQKTKGEKAEEIIGKIIKKKLVLIIRLVNGFNNDVDELYNLEIKKEEKKEQKNKNVIEKIEKEHKDIIEQNIDFNKEKKKILNISEKINEKKDIIEKAIKNIKEAVSKLPEKDKEKFESIISSKQSEIKKNYPNIPEDKVYLLSVAKTLKENKDFANKIQLDTTTKAVLKNIESEFSYIKAEKIVGNSETIQSEITEFANGTSEYDENIKNSLDIPQKMDLETQKLLSKKYEKLVDKYFQVLASKNEGKLDINTLKAEYEKFLNGGETKYDKIFVNLQEKLNQKLHQETGNFVAEYKKTAMESYVKEIFSMFDKTVGTENITKEFDNQNFDIEKNGKIELKFKYNDTPLKFTITKDGEILMTNYTARENQDPNKLDIKENGTFQVKETRLNQFFDFVSVKDLMNVEKINFKSLLSSDKSIKQALGENIHKQIEGKLSGNDKLGNETMMKQETKYEMQRQYLTHKLLTLYRPPVDNKYLEGEGGKIGEDKLGLFSMLNKFDKSLRMQENTDIVLGKLFSNEKFQSLSDNLGKGDDKLTTNELFQKLGFYKQDGTLNTSKINKFEKVISTISGKSDLSKLPEIENFEWEYENSKLKLKKKKEEDVFSKLDGKFNVINI